jgi:hypothetical protein
VLTITALLMAVAGPPLARIHGGTQLRQAVDALAANHSLARATAVKNGCVAELHIDPGTDRHWVQADTGVNAVTTIMGPIVHFKQGDLVSNRTLLCFDARGMPTGAGPCDPPDAMVAFVHANGRADTLRVTGLGRIQR